MHKHVIGLVPESNCPLQQTIKDPLLLETNAYSSEVESYRLVFCVVPVRFSSEDSPSSSLVSQDVVVQTNSLSNISSNQSSHHEESNRERFFSMTSSSDASVRIDNKRQTGVDSMRHLPSTLQPSLMVNEMSLDLIDNENPYGNRTRHRVFNRYDHPRDHVSDEVYGKRASHIYKEEKKLLKSMKKKHRARVLNYHHFAMNMKFHREAYPFSTYSYLIEPMNNSSKEHSMGISDGDLSHVVIKKFKGNEEVSTIYTKDNRNHSLIHSFIAKYPLASDPFDVTCIFVMMFVFSFSLIHS